MADSETLSERVDAVERAVTEDEQTLPDASTVAELAPRVADIEDRQADLDERVTELEAATQALRGYVGSVKSVNEDVEQRADAALAAVDRLEERIESVQGPPEATRSRGVDQSPGQQRSQHDDGARSEQPVRSAHSDRSADPGRAHSTEDTVGDPTGAGRDPDTVSERPREDTTEIRPPRTVGDDHPPGSTHHAEDDRTEAGLLARIRSLL